MRFVVDRWYVVPIVAMVALFACSLVALSGMHSRMTRLINRNVSRIYALASAGQYDELARSGLVTDDTIQYLYQQDQCFGRIKSWKLSQAQFDIYEESREGQVWVERARLQSADRLEGSRVDSLSLVPSYDLYYSNEFENRTTPLRTPDEARKIARAILKASQSDFPVKTFDVARAGEFWLATVIVAKEHSFDTRYLILSKTGKPLSYFEPSSLALDN